MQLYTESPSTLIFTFDRLSQILAIGKLHDQQSRTQNHGRLASIFSLVRGKAPGYTSCRSRMPSRRISPTSTIWTFLAKPVKCRRLPNLKIPHIGRYWLGGACGEAGATHLTVARAELQQKQKGGRVHMSSAIFAPSAARHPEERVVSTSRKGKYCSCVVIGGFALSGTLRFNAAVTTQHRSVEIDLH